MRESVVRLMNHIEDLMDQGALPQDAIDTGVWNAVTAAIVVDREASDWRPIESAPKDGTRILGFDPYVWEGEQVSATSRSNHGKWLHECIIEAKGWDDYGYGYWEPTHWMPLPIPPEAAKT